MDKKQKIQQYHFGRNPQEYVDEMAEYGKKLWDTLKIGYDDFVRTTDKNHEQQVQKIFEYLLEKGDIYKGKYIGNYCKSDESYFTDLQLVKDHRTNYEIGNVQSVIDGNITGFLHEYLILKKNNKIQGDIWKKRDII